MPNENDGQGNVPPRPPESAPTTPAGGGFEQRIVGLANDWMKTRLGLEERPDGSLELPNRGAFEGLGEKADQFMRGFFRGFVEKTPEEREARAGLRDAADVPSATEVAGRLLSRASAAVTHAFHAYLKQEVPPPSTPAPAPEAAATQPNATTPPLTIDGRFLLRHGAPLIGRIVQALGTAFTNPSEANAAVTPDAPTGPHDDAERRVDFKVDLPSLMKSLITGRAEAAPPAPATPATPAPTAAATPAPAPTAAATPTPTPSPDAGGETP